MQFQSINTYINSLPSDILEIEIAFQNLTILPDLSRFTKIKKLYCCCNYLTILPKLPESLQSLFCHGNKLTSLPDLPPNLKELSCSENQLTELPKLPSSLRLLYCRRNKILILPTLPFNLKTIDCYNNPLIQTNINLPINLIYLQCDITQKHLFKDLPLEIIGYHTRHLYLYNVNFYSKAKQYYKNKINKKKKNVRHLFYCLKFKENFRKWYWRAIKEKQIMLEMHPSIIALLLEDKNIEDIIF